MEVEKEAKKKSNKITEQFIKVDTLDPRYTSPSPKRGPRLPLKASKMIRRVEGLPGNLDLLNPTETKCELIQLIVDGFTPGAVKNIFQISVQNIVVLAVSQKSIKFVSKSRYHQDMQVYSAKKVLAKFDKKNRCFTVYYHRFYVDGFVLKLDEMGRIVETTPTLSRSLPLGTKALLNMLSIPGSKFRLDTFFGYLFRPQARFKIKNPEVKVFTANPAQTGKVMSMVVEPAVGERFSEELNSGHPEHVAGVPDSLKRIHNHVEFRDFRVEGLGNKTNLVIVVSKSVLVLKFIDVGSRRLLRSSGLTAYDLLLDEEMEGMLGAGFYSEVNYQFPWIGSMYYCGLNKSLVFELRMGGASLLKSFRIQDLLRKDLKTRGLAQSGGARQATDRFYLEEYDERRLVTIRRKSKNEGESEGELVWIDRSTLEETPVLPLNGSCFRQTGK